MTESIEEPVMTSSQFPTNRIPRVLRQLGIDTSYVLLGFPLATVSFIVLITGLSVGIGLLVVWVGLPLLVATIYAARGFAEVERMRISPVLRRARAHVRYKGTGAGTSLWRRLWAPITDIQSWLDVIHGIVRFPVSVATFSVVIAWWSVALGGVLTPIYDWAIPRDRESRDLVELVGLGTSPSARITLYVIIGTVFAVTLPPVVRGCAMIEAWLGQALLTGVATLRDQVAGLTTQAQTAQAQTVAAVSAEATALRRLERDIHDGPQQRLVRLAVDLGRAQHQLDTDPAAVRQTVDEALTLTRETLDELRTLSRGIAPPILTDRGLAAAVAALAARATVAVDLAIADPGRLAPIAEQTAYFTVAEALTNVAKHSRATRCTITVSLTAARLTVTVTDDGTGGAHVSKGHGLAGLTDRLRSVGGDLIITSPVGGPTTIQADIPGAIVH